MWIPNDAAEIERAAQAGEMPETPSFDAKADLPQPKRNADLAKDVAAMATDGGVLLYGVSEDDNGSPAIPSPIALAGVAERIDQIVAMSIAEVPYIEVREYPTADDPSVGYVLLVVPQSDRAPHQVTVGSDLRFYGRGAKANRPLTEGDVARLYERRQSWSVDREKLLDETVAGSPIPSTDGLGYIHAFARPVVPDQSIFERAAEMAGGRQGLHQRFLNVVNATTLRGEYGPSLERASFWRRYDADTWRLSTTHPDDQDYGTPDSITSSVVADVDLDGHGRFFCGRATDTRINSPTDPPQIIEVVIAGNLEAFFALMAAVYNDAGYHGQIDVGVALTGIRNARSERASRGLSAARGYPSPAFRRHRRVVASQLAAADTTSSVLLRDFFEATTGIQGWDPFTQPENR